MPNENKRPRYRNSVYLGVLVAIVAVIVSILVWQCPKEYVQPDFSISVNPAQGSVQQGGVIQTTITVNDIQGYKYSVSLSASGQPPNVITTFIPPNGGPPPAYKSTLTINVASNVLPDAYPIIIKGEGADGKKHTCTYTLTVLTVKTKPDTSIPTPAFAHVNVPDVFSPSGWMGDWGDIVLDDAFTNNYHSEPTCIKIIYSAVRSQGKGWAGIYWLYPDKNWGDRPEGQDLTGVTALTFWARGEKGGEKAEFKVGGITGKYLDSIQPPVSTGIVVLSDRYQQYTINLAGKKLSHVIGGFCWVTSKSQNPYGCIIYLDDIKYE